MKRKYRHIVCIKSNHKKNVPLPFFRTNGFTIVKKVLLYVSIIHKVLHFEFIIYRKYNLWEIKDLLCGIVHYTHKFSQKQKILNKLLQAINSLALGIYST